MSLDTPTLEYCIRKADEHERDLQRHGCSAQARAVRQLADSYRSALSAERHRLIPRCASCGTTKGLHRDLGSGGPYRCSSPGCLVY